MSSLTHPAYGLFLESNCVSSRKHASEALACPHSGAGRWSLQLLSWPNKTAGCASAQAGALKTPAARKQEGAAWRSSRALRPSTALLPVKLPVPLVSLPFASTLDICPLRLPFVSAFWFESSEVFCNPFASQGVSQAASPSGQSAFHLCLSVLPFGR